MKQQIYNTALYLRLSRDDELQGESSSIMSILMTAGREQILKDRVSRE